MARTAAKPKTNLEAVIRGEAEVRMDLELEHLRIAGDVMSRIEASDARLKDLATTAGHSFKETFLDKGTVSVSGQGTRARRRRAARPGRGDQCTAGRGKAGPAQAWRHQDEREVVEGRQRPRGREGVLTRRRTDDRARS
jgi:hypothetical protein